MLTLSEVNNEMESLKDWSLDSSSIIKSFPFSSFQESLDFLNKISEIAKKHEHSPDVMISQNIVRISLTTHALSGLSKKDFEVAKEIDQLE